MGYKAEEVKKVLGNGVEYFYQENPKGGTGEAVLCAKDFLKGGYTLIVNGDTPLLRESSVSSLLKYAESLKDFDGIVCVFYTQNPQGYGRVLLEGDRVLKIVEERDASYEERRINLVNGGLYLFRDESLKEALKKVKRSPVTGELYLPPVVEFMKEVKAFFFEDETELMGVNNRWELSVAENLLRLRINQELALKGITIHSPESVYIEEGVQIEEEVEIFPNTYIGGKTFIGRETTVGFGSVIKNCKIGRGVKIYEYSLIEDSKVEDFAKVGPFCRIRFNTLVGKGSEIGNFVEVKNSQIGEGVKAKHLAYLGDATLKNKVNVGAGVVFANYDGKRKYKTLVEEGAFIGSNSLLVAPLKLGKYSYVAGGSVITKDIPGGALAVERSPLKILEGKGERKLK